MRQRVVIFGGSGFVGKSIAKRALANQYQVVSISRSGCPTEEEPWMKQVQWVSADVFKPEQWRNQIQTNDILIDAIGLLLEKKAKGLTYETYHYELVKMIVNELIEKQPTLFVYISAAHGLPFFPDYLRWKQAAESYLVKQDFKVLIIKPSLLYGKERNYSRLLALPIVYLRKIPGMASIIGKLDPQPIDTIGPSVFTQINAQLEKID